MTDDHDRVCPSHVNSEFLGHFVYDGLGEQAHRIISSTQNETS